MSGLADIAPEHPLVLVGGGRMGSALLGGWIRAGVAPQAVVVVEPDPGAAAALKSSWPELYVTGDLEQVGIAAETVVLAVKPQIMDRVLPKLERLNDALFLSIAAGKGLSYFAGVLGSDAAIVRAMPNTPASIGLGVSVCIANGRVSEDQKELSSALLEAVGTVEWISNESLMDAVTAVSGSGPAYIFYLAECLAHAGSEAGLPPELAARIARQTVVGAAALLGESDERPAALRQAVTSPGGTTEAALEILTAEGGLPDILTRAIDAAVARSRALAKGD